MVKTLATPIAIRTGGGIVWPRAFLK